VRELLRLLKLTRAVTQQGGVQNTEIGYPSGASRTAGSAAAGLLVGGAAILALA